MVDDIDEQIRDASAALAAHGVVGVPTDTVYGLAVAWGDQRALDRLYRLKGRDADKPVAVLVGSLAAAEELGHFDPRARAVARRFWPGPLTIVVEAPADVAALVRSPEGTVGIRWPDAEVVARLTGSDGALVVTSANRSGHPPARTAAEIREAFGSDVDVVIDGGRCDGAASTVVSFVKGERRILREGEVTAAAIDAALADLP